MINQILKYLWNRRRSNTWIFLELVFVSFFMWGVIDPLYVLISNKAIDEGYNTDNVFLLSFKEFGTEDHRYRKDQDMDSVKKINFENIYRMVQQHPDIETSAISLYSGFPYSQWTSNFPFTNDSLSVMTLMQRFYAGTDFFGVFRIIDAETGKPIIAAPEDLTNDQVYITQNIVGAIFPDKKVKNEIVQADGKEYRVAGITSNYKFQSTEQPVPVIFIPQNEMDFDQLPGSVHICFRIKNSISSSKFRDESQQGFLSTLQIGNFYPFQLTDFNTIRENSEYLNGVTNTMNLQIGLAVFFLICTFLGVSGTFWLRSNERKSEIGLRKALGGSKIKIIKEFLTETWLLTTIAWILGVIIALQRVFYTGFAFPPQYITSKEYIQNHAVLHFLIVSCIVYILMMFIAVIGTWIPAYRAASVVPAMSLHFE